MKKKQRNIFLKDIEMPGIVEDKIEDALLKIRMEETDIMRKKDMADTGRNYKIWRPLKPLIAVAACSVLIITASINRNAGIKNPDMPIAPNHAESDLPEDENFKISFPDFSITAYAAELNIAEANEGNIIFADVGIGADGYTGILFNIQGSGISNVDISIDKGELYSATIEDTTEEALQDWMAQGMPDMDGDPDTYTIVETLTPEQKEENPDIPGARTYHCTKRGANITEEYDSAAYYGFYIPDSVLSAVDAEADLAVAAHDMLSVFDDAVLIVSVTCSDGSNFTKEYELSAAKLLQDENGTITQEEWTGGEEGAFVYGIIARERN